MATLKIVKYGDSVLRKKNAEIVAVDEKIKTLADTMLSTMYEANGLGLAAPQVGISLRMCVIDITSERNKPYVLINPHIIESENKILMEEGCLSFPGLYENVKRFEKVIVEFTNLNGKTENLKATGLLAKAVQHELDHLDAKLFIDYLPEWKRKAVEKEIKRKKKAGQW